MDNIPVNEKPLLKDTNLYIIFIITLFAVLGVASIAPAFPQMIKYFSISDQQVGWLIASFTVPGIIITPFLGVLADKYSRKAVLIPSLLLFSIAGFSCTFARDFHILVVLRFIQGTGAASLGSLNVTLIGDLYEGQKRTKAMGYNASVLSIGTALYPAIGGTLAVFGWNYPFILPLLALPAGFLVLFGLKNPEPKNNLKLNQYFYNLIKIFNQKSVWGLFALCFLVFIILYGSYLVYFPIMLEKRFLLNSMSRGLVMSAQSFITAFVAFQLAQINEFIGKKNQLYLCFISYMLSMVMMAYANNWGLIIASIILFGIAQGIVIPTLQTLLVGYAPIQERGAFMSLNSMVLRAGQTVGPLFVGVFFLLSGLKGAFLTGAVVASFMILISAILIKIKE